MVSEKMKRRIEEAILSRTADNYDVTQGGAISQKSCSQQRSV